MRMVTRKVAVLIVLVALIPGLASCIKKGPAGKPDDVDYYTCTMHPSVKSQDPNGKCPICSMDLVPVMKKGTASMNETNAAMPATINGDEKPGEFTVPVGRQQQTYATIEKQPFI